MNKLSNKSYERFLECHQDLQIVFRHVLQYQDFSVLCGHRTREEQNAAFDRGVTQVRWPDSKHNQTPSMAIDAAPYFKELGSISWDDMIAFALFAGRVLQVADQLYERGIITHRVRSGLDWDRDGRNIDQRFNDGPHFELVDG